MKIGRRTLSIREPQRFLFLSIVIGVGAGLLVVCFHIAIESMSWLTTDHGRLAQFLSPPAGGLLGMLVVTYLFRHARGSGVTDTKAAVYISDGHVPASTIAGKFLACTLSIGMGNPLGPEDPSLHMGAGIASLLGRLFRLNRDRMRLIAPVGAAAGIAAAFNTPIIGVLFVIEEIVAGWSAGVLGSIVLASVSAAVVVRWFLGSQPLFLVPEFQLTHPSELGVHALIGAVCGLLAVGFVKLTLRLRRALGNLRPRATLAGYGTVDGALRHRFPWNMLLVLAVAKAALVLLCFSARTPGGMFAPTLFTGAMIGGGIGGLAEIYWPFPTSSSGAYVLVGVGTFFAGVFRAPMTSIFMIFEVSASYVIILPVMIANTIAYLISRKMEPVPFFTQLAAEEGLEPPSTEQQREAPRLRSRMR